MYAFLVVIFIFFVVLCSDANLAFVGSIELHRCTYAGFAIVSWCCNVQDFLLLMLNAEFEDIFSLPNFIETNVQCDNEDDCEDVND